MNAFLFYMRKIPSFLIWEERQTAQMDRKEEESYMAENNGKSLFTARQIMRVLSFICIIVVFCPSFLVSCSGQSKGISVMTAVGGLSVYGESIAKPQPLMLICLLLPAVILALLFMKKLPEKQNALIIVICGISDFVIWMIFKAVVKKIAEDHYCEFKTTGWYLLNSLALFFLILFALLILLQKLEMDTDILALLSGGGTEGAMNKPRLADEEPRLGSEGFRLADEELRLGSEGFRLADEEP